ncbi:MAG: SDR family NAD(P)-dependent oxidoreductase [Acidimicrobiia bacterium]
MTKPLAGEKVAITGASSGIGRATAVELARRGADLVLVGRSRSRHADVLSDLTDMGSTADYVEAELSELAAVARAAAVLARDHPSISILINNAGLGGRKGTTADGFELAFGVNYLAHFLLTMLLLDASGARAPSTIINLSSNAHYSTKTLDTDRARGRTRSLLGLSEYSYSKAAMAAFSLELASRFPDIRSVTVHPGVVATDGWRRIPRPLRGWWTRNMLTSIEGAVPVVRAVTDNSIPSGSYLTPDGVQSPGRAVSDVEARGRLWDASQQWAARFR